MFESPARLRHACGQPDLIPLYDEPFYRLLQQPLYQPLTASALARKLNIFGKAQKAFTQWLELEEKAGRVVQLNGHRYTLPQKAGLVAGRLQMNDRGFGFLIADDFDGPDIMVPARDTGEALHGDRVLVRIRERGVRRGPGAAKERIRGEVARVLESKRTQIVGAFAKKGSVFLVIPDDRRIANEVLVRRPQWDIPHGHKVVAKLAPRRGSKGELLGEISEVIGPPGQPGVDILSIIKKHELPEEFPDAVVREAAQIGTAIPKSEIAKREDFRALYTFTIDPDDAKDFDDALSYRVLPGGDMEVYVHVADVSYYVRPGSALDTEARERGNSVYLVDRVIPMLPEKLSNGICSLQPRVDRLVKTVVARLGADGRVKTARFAQGIIHSRRRFTYQEALGILRGAGGSDEATHLQAMHRMAQIMRRNRTRRGALNLDFPEHKVRLDQAGRPVRIEKLENDESHQLIEEFMLMANEEVARHLKRKQLPGLYRIHDEPDAAKLDEFRLQIRSFGVSPGALWQRGELSKFLSGVEGHPQEDAIKLQLLRSLPRAVYSHHERGHFGLAMAHYTHFTSPIRRYADLIVHRMIFGQKWDAQQIARIAQHLSVTERRAAEAEGESVLLKKMEFLDLASKKQPKPVFLGMITENRADGMMVELQDAGARGFLPIRNFAGDHFLLNERAQEWRGRKTNLTIRLGQIIPVEVAGVDMIKKQADFATRTALFLLKK